MAGTIYSAVSDGYDRNPLGFDPEPGVDRELRFSPKVGHEAALWNREEKLLHPPTTGQWSCYLDGSLRPSGPIRAHIEGWLSSADVALFEHPHRTCAYEEIDACVFRFKITAREGDNARDILRRAGFPRDYGLWALGMIARRTHANAIQRFVFPACLGLVKLVAPRDQIWFPYMMWKTYASETKVHTIDADIFNNPFFRFRAHHT